MPHPDTTADCPTNCDIEPALGRQAGLILGYALKSTGEDKTRMAMSFSVV